jgi:hypothetical protein
VFISVFSIYGCKCNSGSSITNNQLDKSYHNIENIIITTDFSHELSLSNVSVTHSGFLNTKNILSSSQITVSIFNHRSSWMYHEISLYIFVFFNISTFSAIVISFAFFHEEFISSLIFLSSFMTNKSYHTDTELDLFWSI